MGNMKGTLMIEIVKYLRSHKDRARQLLPEHLHHYLENRILATSWHPEEDYLELMRTIVQIYSPSESGLHVWEEVARRTNPAYFEGPYQALVHRDNPARSLSGFETFWRLVHDTGKAKVELEGDDRARVELHHYVLVNEESCSLVQGTLWGLLSHAGAREIELRHSRCRARGDAHCEWQAGWSA